MTEGDFIFDRPVSLAEMSEGSRIAARLVCSGPWRLLGFVETLAMLVILVTSLGLALVGGWIVLTGKAPENGVAVAYLPFLIVAGYIGLRHLRLRHFLSVTLQSPLAGDVVTTVSKDGLIQETESSRLHFGWPDIDRFAQGKKTFVFTAANGAIILPKVRLRGGNLDGFPAQIARWRGEGGA
ncbi:YcxB family protein [Marimonas arenosa]|uniref:YcxB family protein n=1 Tax=Marimonas arenosa TaxID=1795305 RepID=A0AAE4B6J5_9RHOB|nr:YcxB family protein [Marimonas arenosa]MDQ2092375.1 YcxB family protein [Marimonas arenosa]